MSDAPRRASRLLTDRSMDASGATALSLYLTFTLYGAEFWALKEYSFYSTVWICWLGIV